jgi:hypothetical protein
MKNRKIKRNCKNSKNKQIAEPFPTTAGISDKVVAARESKLLGRTEKILSLQSKLDAIHRGVSFLTIAQN